MLNQHRQLNTIDELQGYLQDKKVLILDPFLWTPHLETSLEISSISKKYAKSTNFQSFWLEANIEDRMDWKRKLYRYLSLKVPTILFFAIKNCPPIGFIKSITFQLRAIARPKVIDFAFDMDDAIYSSYLSVRKNSDKTTQEYKKFHEKLSKTVKKTYTWVDHVVNQIKPDVVVLFNGRYATTRIIRNYCEYHNIDYIIHERGCDKDHFSVWLNCLPHNPKSVLHSFNHFVTLHQSSKLAEIGKDFFQKRRQGKNKGWHSFMSDYVSPEFGNFEKRLGNKKIITYFTSTDDEFKALKSDLPPIGPFSEQPEAIRAVQMAAEKHGFTFVLRLHPNLATRSLNDRKQFPYVEHTIEPDEKISSYRLIEMSAAVFTHNSQIALEATAMNRHSALTGRSRFEGLKFLNICRYPNEIEDFVASLTSEIDMPGANIFGGYLALNGIRYKKYFAKTLSRGLYNKIDLNFPWFWK